MKIKSYLQSPLFPQIKRPAKEIQAPVVVSIPHSGIFFPEEERAKYLGGVERFLMYTDLYTDELYGPAWKVGATVISSPFNRFIVDLNRFHDDYTDEVVEEADFTRKPGYYGARGVIWAIDTYGARIYKKRFSPKEVQERLFRYYFPYHAAVREELNRLHQKFGIAILIDGHSMPSRALISGRNLRADIVPGNIDHTSCDPWLTAATTQYWRKLGYTVSVNDPYAGGATTRRYGAPNEGFHSLQLELSRALYMNERSLKRSHFFEKMCDQTIQYVAAVIEKCTF